jgi:hypothetical protein
MKTVKCPQGDKGLCTIPDRTAMITADALRPISREELTERYPQLDLVAGDLARVDADPGAVRDVLGSPGDSRAASVHAALRSAFARTPGSTSLVVYCTCGHVYIADAP